MNKLLGLSLLLISNTVLAAGGMEPRHVVSATGSSGIADSNFLGSNGAGWAYNSHSKVVLGAGTTTSNFSAFNYQGGLALGNSKVGGGILATYVPATTLTVGGFSVTTPATLGALAGLGFDLKTVAVGVNANMTISPTFALGSIVPGILINPDGKIRIGANFATVSNLIGAGVAADLGNNFVLAGDITTPTSGIFSTWTITPGLKYISNGERFTLAGNYALTRTAAATTGTIGAALAAQIGMANYLTLSTTGFTSYALSFAIKI
ncbi:MAG: hypothetical protein KA715_08850 [Xanthomonadaceae bacterium]|nr:hypothetical protein [Xanthomonadaceae bacterium]